MKSDLRSGNGKSQIHKGKVPGTWRGKKAYEQERKKALHRRDNRNRSRS